MVLTMFIIGWLILSVLVGLMLGLAMARAKVDEEE